MSPESGGRCHGGGGGGCHGTLNRHLRPSPTPGGKKALFRGNQTPPRYVCSDYLRPGFKRGPCQIHLLFRAEGEDLSFGF